MLTAIVTLMSQGLANQALRMLALKVFLRLLLIMVVPLVILMGFNLILGELVSFVVNRLADVNVGQFSGYSITGIGAYLYAELGLDIAMGAVLGAMGTKLLLRSIPFLRL